MKYTTSLSNLGTVISVRGSVVDVRFDVHLPPIYSLLHAKEGEIAIEVLAQLDAHRVRGIALTPTQGLARGMAVEDTGGPLHAPVGKGILSRMFDVFGKPIDRQEKFRTWSGAPSIAPRHHCLGAPPNQKFSRLASKSSMCSCRWSAAAKRAYLAVRAWARRCC